MTKLDEKTIHSAYIDGDHSVYFYDKEENSLDGWPEDWPEWINRKFLEEKGIIIHQ